MAFMPASCLANRRLDEIGMSPRTIAACATVGLFLLTGGYARSQSAGPTWSLVGSVGGGVFFPAAINSIASFDDGGGEALFVAGTMTTIDGVAANGIARWDGTSWASL